jgi:hypothetical protein
MDQMTIEKLKELGYQNKIQFGSRVETECGKRGIVNFNSSGIDLCRVYYDTPEDKECRVKSIKTKMSTCRLLTLEEAVNI